MTPALLDPRNGPGHDCPPAEPGVRRYVIASLPRSGSTLLARLLWDTGRVGRPKEYLNPMQLRDWEVRLGSRTSRLFHGTLTGQSVGVLAGRGWSAQRLLAHLRRTEKRRSIGGWYGLKLHHHHFERYGGWRALGGWLESVRWVRIERQDRLGQAISWSRALQSGRWAAWQSEVHAAHYSRAAIRRRLAAIERAESGWDQALRHEDVLGLSYEELVSEPETTVRRVLAWLEISDAASVEIPSLPTKRQADATTHAWRARWASGV